MWEHFCVACVGLIFFGAKGVFSMDICHLFQQCMLILIFLIGNDLVNRVCTEFWAGPPLCSAVIFALSGVESALSLFVRIKTPWSVLRCVSDPWWEVGRNGVLPLGQKTLSFPALELFTCKYILGCRFSPQWKTCWLKNYTVLGTDLSPKQLAAIGPDVSQALFSTIATTQIYQSQLLNLPVKASATFY